MMMDRAAVRVMVEDFWRSFIPVAFNGDRRNATSIVERFQKQIDDMAALMPTNEAAAFLDLVEEERDVLFKEYNAAPDRLKARLGVSAPRDAPRAPRAGARMGLGELAVRTTVRATVWETVRSVFRLAR